MAANRPTTPGATNPAPSPRADPDDLAFARSVISQESLALAALAESLGEEFLRAVGLLVACADSGGSVLVSGLGKSGHVGNKISATLTSLGMPSHAVHPSEAAHGDLGRFRRTDTAVCISFSGETDEVVNLASVLRQDGLPIIAITGGAPGAPSSLERLATVALRLGFSDEAAGEFSIAPTKSTTATMALGDALALCAARRRNFTHEEFARRHPGGTLGGLLRPVTDMLRTVAGRNMALIPHSATVEEALAIAETHGRRPGAIVLVDPASGRLSGIFTDADLRRLFLKDPAGRTRPIESVMTRTPRALPNTALVRDAVRMVREFRQDEIPVVDEAGRPVGLLDVQDLITMRLVQD